MTKDEALDLALKALRFARDDGYENEVSQEAIIAIKQARSAPVHKPYRPLQDNGSQYFGDSWDTPPAQPSSVQPSMPKKIDEVTRSDGSLKYSPNFAAGWNAAIDAMATPPAAQRQWVGLTDEEMSEVYNQADWDTVNGWEYERAIEAKLRSKNNG